MPELKTEFAFTVRASVAAPVVIGQGPEGLRRYIPITGGTVEGPQIQGRVLAAGGDSQVVRADGAIALEARYVLQTDDGVLISVVNRGLRHAPPGVMERLMRGERLDPAQYYFRTAAQFEAPLGSRYEWLNKAIFVSTAEREPGAAVVHFHRVL